MSLCNKVVQMYMNMQMNPLNSASGKERHLLFKKPLRLLPQFVSIILLCTISDTYFWFQLRALCPSPFISQANKCLSPEQLTVLEPILPQRGEAV